MKKRLYKPRRRYNERRTKKTRKNRYKQNHCPASYHTRLDFIPFLAPPARFFNDFVRSVKKKKSKPKDNLEKWSIESLRQSHCLMMWKNNRFGQKEFRRCYPKSRPQWLPISTP